MQRRGRSPCLTHHAIDKGGDLGFVRHIDGRGHALAACSDNFPQAIGRRRAVAIGQCDEAAARCQPPGHARANAGPRARDDRYFHCDFLLSE